MASKEELLASLIEQQKVLTEQTDAVANIEHDGNKTRGDGNNEGEQEYVYWARRGELETAGEVEVCSSTGSENHEGAEILVVDETLQGHTTEVSTSEENGMVNGVDEPVSNTLEIEDCFPKYEDLEQQRRMEEKRETARLQEQIMNEEYQKAIGYLLCSSKSKSGKQKKKQTMTAYLFFCRRYRSKIVARNPKLSFAQISKLLSHMWRNASEQEKNMYRVKLEQHRTKVNAIVEKNMIEKMKMVKQQKLVEELRRQNEEEEGGHGSVENIELAEQETIVEDGETEQGGRLQIVE